MVLFPKLAPILPRAAVQVAVTLADQVQGQQVSVVDQAVVAVVLTRHASVVLGLQIKETMVVIPLVRVTPLVVVAVPAEQVLMLHQVQVQVPVVRV